MIKSLCFLFVLNTVIISKPILHYPNEFDAQNIKDIKQKLKEYKTNSQKKISKFNLNTSNYEEIKHTLNKFFPYLVISYSNKTNSLIIKHKKDDLESIKKIIKNLDQDSINTYLKCKIYEISINKQKEKDLLNQIINGPYNLTYNKSLKIVNTKTILDSIKLLESKGRALLIAEPSIKLTNKKESSLVIGNKIPYSSTSQTAQTIYQQIKSFQTGIDLKITPLLTNKSIICDILLKLTHIKNWKIINNQELPILSNREIKNTLHFKYNTPKLIGSYVNTIKSSNKIIIPILRKIPILKNLFNFSTVINNETLFLIFFEVNKIKALE